MLNAANLVLFLFESGIRNIPYRYPYVGRTTNWGLPCGEEERRTVGVCLYCGVCTVYKAIHKGYLIRIGLQSSAYALNRKD